MATKKDYVVGSGNVFADLGYARPEEAAAKAELAHKITKIIERRKLTQAEAANVLEVDQPKVSALKRGKLSGFSLDRLVRFLVLLGSDVEIVVKKSTAQSAPREAACRVAHAGASSGEGGQPGDDVLDGLQPLELEKRNLPDVRSLRLHALGVSLRVPTDLHAGHVRQRLARCPSEEGEWAEFQRGRIKPDENNTAARLVREQRVDLRVVDLRPAE